MLGEEKNTARRAERHLRWLPSPFPFYADDIPALRFRLLSGPLCDSRPNAFTAFRGGAHSYSDAPTMFSPPASFFRARLKRRLEPLPLARFFAIFVRFVRHESRARLRPPREKALGNWSPLHFVCSMPVIIQHLGGVQRTRFDFRSAAGGEFGSHNVKLYHRRSHTSTTSYAIPK